jgi:hypothetical protein
MCICSRLNYLVRWLNLRGLFKGQLLLVEVDLVLLVTGNDLGAGNQVGVVNAGTAVVSCKEAMYQICYQICCYRTTNSQCLCSVWCILWCCGLYETATSLSVPVEAAALAADSACWW